MFEALCLLRLMCCYFLLPNFFLLRMTEFDMFRLPPLLRWHWQILLLFFPAAVAEKHFGCTLFLVYFHFQNWYPCCSLHSVGNSYPSHLWLLSIFGCLHLPSGFVLRFRLLAWSMLSWSVLLLFCNFHLLVSQTKTADYFGCSPDM